MPIFPESSTLGDQIRLRRSGRNNFHSHHLHRHQLDPAATAEIDPNPQLSRPPKSTTISSLFISPFSANSSEPTTITIANNSTVGGKKKVYLQRLGMRCWGCPLGVCRDGDKVIGGVGWKESKEDDEEKSCGCVSWSSPVAAAAEEEDERAARGYRFYFSDSGGMDLWLGRLLGWFAGWVGRVT
ncbi:unnamed protein product [Linum trigynum]|uniref:Uncharacterized protein n=1 Tax=Linum trigynum TaxID=586398 RepID=A0AAV2G5D5_9ROSI